VVKALPVSDGVEADSSDVTRRLEQWREFMRDEANSDGDDLPKG
jgi:hypothetical protein